MVDINDVIEAPTVVDAAPVDAAPVDAAPPPEAEPTVSVAPADPTAFVDPTYQCDHPILGRAGTLRIWRWENGFGSAITRNFTTGQLSVQHVKFTGVEVNKYDIDGDEITLGSEDEIAKHVLGRKAL